MWHINHLKNPDTLPETNIAPENGGFPIGLSFSRGLFSGAMLVLGGVTFNSRNVMTRDHHLRARDTGSTGYDRRNS